jgi:hypothetical protein
VAGQIISVSTLSIGKGAAIAVKRVNGSAIAATPSSNINKVTGNTAGDRHNRANQMGANITALSMFEVAIRCRSYARPRRWSISAATH